MRRLYLSHSNRSRLDAAQRWLETIDSDEVLVLGATRRAADDFVRSFVQAKGSAIGIHRSQLTHLARDLAAPLLARDQLAPVSQLGSQALAARAIYNASQSPGLGYFEPISRTPGFPRALADTLLELRLADLRSEDIAPAGPAGADLAVLSDAYERVLDGFGVADAARLTGLATEAASHKAHRLLGLPVLLLDVSVKDRAEIGLLREILAHAPEVVATAHIEDSFAIDGLERALGSALECVRLDDPLIDSALGRARSRLFQSGVDETSHPPDESLLLFSSSSEAEECVEILRMALWAAEAGTPFDRMAVLLRDSETYAPLLRDAARRAGVPAFFTSETRRPDPAGRALLALLECAAEGFPASRFAEYLSLGQTPAVDETTGAPVARKVPWIAPKDVRQLVFETAIGEAQSSVEAPMSVVSETTVEDTAVLGGSLRTPFHWERLLVDASVVGGRPRWARRLEGLERQLELQIVELREEEARSEELERQLDRLRRLQSFALPIIEFLGSLPKQATWGAWLDFMTELAGMALASTDEVVSVLNQLRPMSRVGPVSLDEVREVLAEELSFNRPDPGPNERRFGKLFVASIEEAAGRDFDIVFLPGLAEGTFPKKLFEDPLLLDTHRQALDEALRLRDDRAKRERTLLRLAVSAASERLLASYPRLDTSQGRPRVPSFYALDLLRAAEGRLPDLGELERRAMRATDTHLGWPAPEDPSRAIDEAEHDLSVLADLIHRPAKEVKGRARYLLSTNVHLERSLKARGRRWRSRWFAADGLLELDDKTHALLGPHRLKTRSYSPTALQHYAACPYRFWLYTILRLRPRDELVQIEEIDPLTRGSLFHAVQFRLGTELKRRDLLPVTAENSAEVMDILEETLEEVAASYQEQLAPAIMRVWNRGVRALRTDLRGWLKDTLSRNQEWVPERFEYAFGLSAGDERDPTSLDSPAAILGGYLLRGSIDLVERRRDDSARRVTDYKTGRVYGKTPRLIGGGETLQPILYALVAEALLDLPVESGQLYYATQKGSYRVVSIPVNDVSRAKATDVLETVESAIEEGFFPRAPREGACRYCDYRIVCGPNEEERVLIKDPERLRALSAIRSIQ